jgi:hypothetical protein
VKFVRWVAILALGFLGISSVIGAVPMILDPDGTPWQMPQSLLDRSPFDSYLIPGIILLIANGALSLSSLIAVVRRDPGYGWWVVLQGVVLAVWLVVEIAMIRHLWVGYFVFGGIAILLIVSGILLKPAQKAA